MAKTEVLTDEAPKKQGKRALQKQRTRARLLEVALNTFAARGFEGTSVRDVAAEAQVNHGMIKYYFENKDQLWRAAITFLFERMDHELGGKHEEDDGADALTKAKNRVRRYVHYCARHPEHARMMVQESIRDNERLRWAVKTFIRPQHEAAATIREQAKDQGIWPDIPDSSLAYIIVASAQMPFMLGPEVQHLYGVDMFEERHINAHAEALITILFDHRAPRAGD